MGRPKDVGVYRKANGVWEYRFITTVNGKQIQRKKCTDAQGNKLMTKTAAIAARTAAIQALHQEGGEWRKPGRYTVKTIFEEFRTKGRKDRAYQTIRKQDSLWKNHLLSKFGDRYLDTLTSGEVMDYLAELYCGEGYSYRYWDKNWI